LSFFDLSTPDVRARGLAAAVDAIADEQLVVLPTDTTYGVAADAFSELATARLRRARKGSRSAPPPVLIPHVRTLAGITTDVSPAVRALAEAFWPGALTLLCRSQPTLNWDLGDTGGTVAVRMPLHPVALELLERTGPMALSAANQVGGDIPLSCLEARRQLEDAVEVYLDGGPSLSSVPSTIVDGTAAVPRLLRVGGIGVAELRSVVPELETDEFAAERSG
jgi:tRNA threonylcarbamoyl adenosine modification protein (Sua5/YciO/YrdC/YwlC family)